MSLLTVFASAQQQARQFQIRAQEVKKTDRDSDSATTLHQQLRARQLQQPASAPSSSSYEYSEEEEEENLPAQAYQRQTVAQPQQRQYQHQQQVHQQQGKKLLTKKQRERLEEELEEELEEPDQLALLLAKSSFSCNTRTTGYYADDTVGCQVFHYCQENTKHSWICPEGATFHQVHLICMPPSDENICEQSAKYHFVNDYLYKPINMEEHQSKPNVSLR